MVDYHHGVVMHRVVSGVSRDEKMVMGVFACAGDDRGHNHDLSWELVAGRAFLSIKAVKKIAYKLASSGVLEFDGEAVAGREVPGNYRFNLGRALELHGAAASKK